MHLQKHVCNLICLDVLAFVSNPRRRREQHFGPGSSISEPVLASLSRNRTTMAFRENIHEKVLPMAQCDGFTEFALQHDERNNHSDGFAYRA